MTIWVTSPKWSQTAISQTKIPAPNSPSHPLKPNPTKPPRSPVTAQNPAFIPGHPTVRTMTG